MKKAGFLIVGMFFILLSMVVNGQNKTDAVFFVASGSESQKELLLEI
jgi:hypothetical protein